jgi:general secretion pathway protein L
MTRYLLAAEGGIIPLAGDEDGPLVAVLPGTDIALHRVRLSATAERARRQEAEALAETLAAAPVSDLHVALGPPEADGSHWIAIADREALAGTIARIGEAGHAPDLLVPAALLLPPAAGDAPATATLGDLTLLRAADWAGAVEPALAAELGAPGPHPPFVPVAPPGFELRQGRLARREAFWKPRWFRSSAAALVLLGLALAAVPPLASRLTARLEAETLDRATLEIAARALGTPMADPAEAAEALAKAAGPPLLSPRLAALLAALEPAPGASLASLTLKGGTLEARLEGPADAINRVAQALAAPPASARQEGDRLLFAPGSSGGLAAPDAGAGAAAARFAAVRAAAPRAAARRAALAAGPATLLARQLAGIGLPEVRPETVGAGARAVLPAVKASLLLPLLGRLEAEGLRITGLAIARNPDPSLAVTLEVG